MAEETKVDEAPLAVKKTPVEGTERPISSETASTHEKIETEKPVVGTSTIEEKDEPVPHLHAKTYLTVFAICLIYFAQLINVVGAGAVSHL